MSTTVPLNEYETTYSTQSGTMKERNQSVYTTTSPTLFGMHTEDTIL